MKKIKSNKGFTLVELLAVIVVLAIVMGIAAVAITSVLDNTRKSTFATNAKLFIDGARDLVTSTEMSDMIGGTAGASYAPKCDSTNTPKYIPVLAVNLESGGVDSPYNNKYIKGTTNKLAKDSVADIGVDADGKAISYVKVTPTFDATTSSCTYEYSIFLSDGVYAVGKSGNEVKESEIATTSVQPLS